MNARKLCWLLLAGLAAGVLLMVISTVSISKLLHVKAEQLASNKAQVNQLTSKQGSLVRAHKDIARYASLSQTVKAIVPQDKDQAQTVRELTNIASANQVTLTSVVFPNSNLGALATPATGAIKSVTTPMPVSNLKSALSQLTPVTNIPGVYNLQITLSNNSANAVTFTQLDAFLRGLENNRRTAAVSSLNIQPQQNNPGKLVFTLIINDYVKPS